MYNQNLSIYLTIAGVILILLMWIIFEIGHSRATKNISTKLRNELEVVFHDRMQDERMKLLTKGEKVGYEKGIEAGKQEAYQHLREDFILFLEEQVRLLKNRQLE